MRRDLLCAAVAAFLLVPRERPGAAAEPEPGATEPDTACRVLADGCAVILFGR